MPKKSETKTKAEIIEELISTNRESQFILELRERFLQSKVINPKSGGSSKYEIELGQIQAKLSETKEIIEYLEKIKSEYKYL